MKDNEPISWENNVVKSNYLARDYKIFSLKFNKNISFSYMIPADPAVKPTARKKTNSSKSLGKEFTIS